MKIEQMLTELIGSAADDDLSFVDIVNAALELEPVTPDEKNAEKLIRLVTRMLDQGFIPVDGPTSNFPPVPWPEVDRIAILQRVRREYCAVPGEVDLTHGCWFHLPQK